MRYFRYIFLIVLLSPFIAWCQFSINANLDNLSYSSPKEYELAGITVSGTSFFSNETVISLSGLSVGDDITVPGEKITQAVKNLWNQKLFSDVKISATKIEGNYIFLNIGVEELPRLSKYRFKGIKKGRQNDLREELDLIRGKVVSENLLINTKNTVHNYFIKKGYLKTEVNVIKKADSTTANNVTLLIDINLGERIRIQDINFINNPSVKASKLRASLKETKRRRFYNIFTVSKFMKDAYEKEKNAIVEKYNEKGFRDAKILTDTTYFVDEKLINLDITVEEGKQYYFGDIKWVGNSVHSTQKLNQILDIKKGEVYNKKTLDARLFMNPNGRDVSSLYLDDGYLFFQVTPVEIKVENDSIDLEMRIYEGKQARINSVTLLGNTKTKDHVVRREIRTRPGQLFSRSDIIRTQRELAQLGYFNPETLGVNPKPNQEDGTVDIEYVVEEKPSDQIELSGGWGNGRIVGTLGVSFNNFSARNLFKGKEWRPLPAGDGQRLSIRAQSTGIGFQSYSFSFTEPWLGGRKPNSFSISLSHTVQNSAPTADASSGIRIYNASVGLGRRLKIPDDFFTLYNEVSYQYYVLDNFSSFVFSNGFANNISFKTVLSRNSINNPIYPRTGAVTTFTASITPPYSAFRDPNTDYDALSNQEKFKFIEYHKWKFQTSWFSKLAGNLVLNTKAGFGYVGSFNKGLGTSPFERFYLGGDGLSGFNLDGREIIALRGYGNGRLSPGTGASSVVKYTAELRYPLSLNPNATIYGLVFGEAGNSWGDITEINPFQVKKSAGFGVRIFMPMFGLLGLDWGYRFDDMYNSPGSSNGSEIHFSIGGNINGW